jgi:A/G-specific adenine glycosylase
LKPNLIHYYPSGAGKKLPREEEKMSYRQAAFALKEWFESQKRELPWRKNRSFYRIWVSEVMLQQTQVSVVIPYFEKWLRRFPTLESLAQAPFEEVLKTWEGLGYYSRVRNLHLGARYIFEELEGKIPSSEEMLRKIPGIGPYTAGAIMNFAFRQKARAIDGNVKRVLARYFFIDEPLEKRAALQKIERFLDNFLECEEPWVIMEGLIELGALICTKSPSCSICPLKSTCLAKERGEVESIPVISKKMIYSSLLRHVAVIICDEKLLLKKSEKGFVMADLYEFPYFEVAKEMKLEEEKKALFNFLSLEPEYCGALQRQKHSFTRFRVTLLPSLWRIKTRLELPPYHWYDLKEIASMSFSSGHRRMLEGLIEDFTHGKFMGMGRPGD